MSISTPDGPEHELPSIEAILAGTLALMTGYSQALQAAQHPEKRLAMGAKIGWQLAVLAGNPLLSTGFREVLGDLQQRWLSMTACTLESQPAPRDADRMVPSPWAAEDVLPPLPVPQRWH